MVKMYLPQHPAENAPKRARLYVEYELGDTEKRLEGLFRGLGLRFAARKLDCSGTDTGGRHPNNIGYDIGIVDYRTYRGMGAWYGRWTCITRETSLEKVLEQLRADDLTYQYLTFYFNDDDSKTLGFEAFGSKLVHVDVDKRNPTIEKIKKGLVETSQPQHSLIIDHGDSEEYKFAVPLIDLARTVIEVFQKYL